MAFWKPRRNKFNARTCKYGENIYHSRREAQEAASLDLQVKAGTIKSWDRQVRISLDVNGKHIANYYADFRIVHLDGSIEILEVKGFATDVYLLKKKLLEATYLKDHPEIRYTVKK